ncbi:hypothetical protein KJZ71_04795 [Patescibacteria group bacterium]|uniref:Uncharacterized protein n=1 Tax=candidate division WWE3 bacterium TaxID=2053526 RepID=A0A928TPX1_UNCKA|nr:hypothetical protein [candidate division WWE3 bacterium]MCL4733086.1 hypothetical protein [Patescibacteria group bacterium]MDL1953453.1 hypothetical protein [Candidatus Uhrbacteria bacterium UHB]RIL00497.1 MAG: hypothetical protein DCC77_02955 [Candidatus Uhrbacteria bacterium]
MSTIPTILAGITGIFFLLLFIQRLVGRTFCALCASVSLAWLTLFVLYRLGQEIDPAILGVLMGASVTGALYMLSGKLPERFRLFKLPFFLSGILAVYALLGIQGDMLSATGLLLVLWTVFAAAYAVRHQPAMGRVVQRIIACCRDW